MAYQKMAPSLDSQRLIHQRSFFVDCRESRRVVTTDADYCFVYKTNFVDEESASTRNLSENSTLNTVEHADHRRKLNKGSCTRKRRVREVATFGRERRSKPAGLPLTDLAYTAKVISSGLRFLPYQIVLLLLPMREYNLNWTILNLRYFLIFKRRSVSSMTYLKTCSFFTMRCLSMCLLLPASVRTRRFVKLRLVKKNESNDYHLLDSNCATFILDVRVATKLRLDYKNKDKYNEIIEYVGRTLAEHDHASELITEKLVERRGIFATKVMTIFLGKKGVMKRVVKTDMKANEL
jgi:hypothetical protein